MKISRAARAKLKKPMGQLLSPKAAARKLKGKFVIAVGDRTGKVLMENGIKPRIWIYDGKEMRKKVQFKLPFPTHIVSNPKGHVSDHLRMAVKDALRVRKGLIYVQGEEDLAALPVLESAPASAFVVYGQPREGIVIIRPDRKMKEFVKEILSG